MPLLYWWFDWWGGYLLIFVFVHHMLIPVVLSGGAGSRLWPVSREGRPKPFMQLADGQSLLLKTYIRAAGVVLSARV